MKVGTERKQGYPGGWTRVLGPVMGFPVQQRSGHFEQSPTNVHCDEYGNGAFLLCRKVEKTVTVRRFRGILPMSADI